MQKLYDKAGSVFVLDHEHGGKAYVRPLVKVVMQSGYGEDLHEDEDFEPAAYLVTMDRSDLFDAPPLAVINDEISAKKAELADLISGAKKSIRDLNIERDAAERGLRAAKSQLEKWMQTHRVMLDLGKLLDGQVLYPLSVRENHYHHGRDIPRIPTMRNAKYLAIDSGDFEKGQKWVCRRYGSDTHGSPFMFFDTEDERASVIQAEFDSACQSFRSKPSFDTTSHTTSTTLHYGTIIEWVATHPALSIPEDIAAMKAAHDAEEVEKRKAKLAAELAAMDAA